MGSEILLYGYGIVCLSMLVYNIVYNMIMHGSDTRLERRKKILAGKIFAQIDRLRHGESIEPQHMRYIRRKLSNISYLIAFDHVLQEMQDAMTESIVRDYRRGMQRVILKLAVEYRDRENMQAAYFAYLLSKMKSEDHMSVDTVMEDVLVGYMKKDSLYCKVNALQALCDIGSPQGVFRAMQLLDMRNGVLHDKIITDLLLTYRGKHEALISYFWQEYENVSPRIQLPFLNYLRFISGDYREQMYQVMMDEQAGKELRISAIRYLGKYCYEKAKQDLITFARDKAPLKWEYAATATLALGNYEGQEVLDVLMEVVHSTNWYIRYNAAESLQQHHLVL